MFTTHLSFHLLHLENGDDNSVSLGGQQAGGNWSNGTQYLPTARFIDSEQEMLATSRAMILLSAERVSGSAEPVGGEEMSVILLCGKWT